MDKTSVINSIRQLVGNAQIDSAISKLMAFLEGERTGYRELANRVLQLKSQWEKTQQDETLGIITEENAKLNYNRITHALVNLLDELESPPPLVEKRRRLLPWMLILVGLTVIAGVLIIFRGGGGECPRFPAYSDFNILVLPFKPLKGGQVGETHNQIVTRLADYSDEYGIPASVKAGIIDPATDPDYPNSNKTASAFGERCLAQLIIWGTTEDLGDRDIVQTRFRFNLGERFAFKKLSIDEQADVDTITSLSSITTDGTLTENIEANIKLLFGIVAHHAGKNEVATRLLEGAEVTDSAGTLLKGMMLADSYLAMGDQEEAVKSLDQVLETHPDYGLALNNRAVLYFQKGKFAEAVEDLSKQIDADPGNLGALATRASVYLQADQLDKAELDLRRAAQSSSPDTTTTRYLEKKLEQLEVKKALEVDRRTRADSTLEQRPLDVGALLEKAEASRNLGDYVDAEKAAAAVIRREPANTRAHAIRIEAAREVGTPEKVKQFVRDAERVGVSRDSILQRRPLLRKAITSRGEEPKEGEN